VSRLTRLKGPSSTAWSLLIAWALLGPFLAARILGGSSLDLASRLLEPSFAWIMSLGDVATGILLARALQPSRGVTLSLARLPLSPRAPFFRHWLTYSAGALAIVALRGGVLAFQAPSGLGLEALTDFLRLAPALALLWALSWSAARAGALGVFGLWVALALSFVLREGWQPPLVQTWKPGLLWLGIALCSAPIGARLGPWVEAEAAAWRGLPLANLVRWGGRCVILTAGLVIGLGVLQLEASQLRQELWIELTTPAGLVRYRAEDADRALNLAAAGPRLRAALKTALPDTGHDQDPGLSLSLDDSSLREGELGLARRLAELRLKRILGPLTTAPPLETLSEGAAAHLALRVSASDPFWYRYQVGVYWARGSLTPDALWDRRVLREPGFEALGPALGEAACAVLTRRIGPEGVSKLLSAWQREAAARGRWRSAQSCREAWARVLSEFDLTPADLWEGVVSLALEAREDPRARFPLPRLRASIAAEDDPIGWMIYAEPELELPPGWQIDCRVRWEGDEPAWQLQPSGLAGDAQTFFLRSRELRRPPQVQLGVTNPSLPGPETTGAVWEEWVEWRLQGE